MIGGLCLTIAFVWSWAIGAAAWRADAFAEPTTQFLYSFAYMWGPALGAVVAVQFLPRGTRIEALGLRWRWNLWLVAAWAIPILLVAGALALSTLAPGAAAQWPSEGARKILAEQGGHTDLSDMTLTLIVLAQATLMGALINTPLLISEELGWRGLLWSQWQARLGFWGNALLTGFVWGVWHAPLIALGHNWPGMPIEGPFLMLAFCMLLTPALHWVRECGGSVWHACLFHGTLNAAATIGPLVIIAPNWMSNGIVGLGGFAMLAISALLVSALRRPPAA
ncbi:MAG: CPBP family intramembrane metalloprotease [Alphaproteobacteria bacterium]|nr:CPBP family intramembrane metalloprotease [Alphaproteobacteria bacterium]